MNCILISLYLILLTLSFGIGHYLSKETNCYKSAVCELNCCEGYRVIDNECIPICEGGCPKSQVCLKPNVCGCEDNSLETDDKRCSICVSTFSDQTLESSCFQCRPKYAFIDDACDHLCHENCTNSDCYLDYTRKCNPGFQENPKTGGCEPIPLSFGPVDCAEGSNCQNLLTTSTNSSSTTTTTITTPQTTTTTTTTTTPQTTTTTTTPKTTTTTTPQTTTTTESTMNCQNECFDGTCINGFCQKHSSTISSDETNFTFSTSMDFTYNCTDGICQTEEEENSTISIPTVDVTSNCQNGCWGGICYDGICQCKEGLILDEVKNDCIMPCENNCQNGICNQDHICECNQGYVHQNDTGCVPQCDRECVNSVCVAPTHCECLEGDISSLNISSALECLPTCHGIDGKQSCQNGTCVAVNKCQCLDGFVPKPGNDRFECIPVFVGSRDSFRKKLLYSMWIIVILALLVIILLAFLAQKRYRRIIYNVGKVEIYQTTVEFRVNDELEGCRFSKNYEK
ncbi:scavenger receptor class F member 1-like [Episyrphus balteatus]|uniref:scavenger receptor class F member 1-like n=1 Tax=Episyrphus balteatus TaxID=286459 RepID=UPI002484E157|nr:scavenger receptor class F member 1-like [Episyrphus balteatus]